MLLEKLPPISLDGSSPLRTRSDKTKEVVSFLLGSVLPIKYHNIPLMAL